MVSLILKQSFFPHLNFTNRTNHANHDDMETHRESAHDIGKKKLKCEHCPYTSATMSHMKEHIEAVHQRTRMNSCKECGFTPSRNRDLKRHMKVVHTKSHVCEDCGYAESRKALLTSHRLVVHKIRN